MKISTLVDSGLFALMNGMGYTPMKISTLVDTMLMQMVLKGYTPMKISTLVDLVLDFLFVLAIRL